jgi:regulatory factor X 1/2/3
MCIHNLNFFIQHPHHHQYLGDGSGAIPDFPDIEFPSGLALPEDCTLEDVDTFRSIYREHCEVIPYFVYE